jgi:hypothetical protein
MELEDFILNLLAGTLGGLVSGIALLLNLDLQKQNPDKAFLGSLFMGLLLFIVSVIIGLIIISIIKCAKKKGEIRLRKK